VNLHTGCVVSHQNRKWILWDKRGMMVRLVEPIIGYGPCLTVETHIDECKFVAVGIDGPYKRRNWLW
jgi:hypothetical protein